jgi:hypothetical protein
VATTASSPKTRTQHSAPTAQQTKADANVKWWSEKGYPAPRPAPPPMPLPLASLRCYAQRYTDLLAGYCGGKGGKGGKVGSCDWAAVLAHWEGHGRAEGRVFECTNAPSPPLLLPSSSPMASLSPSPPTRVASPSPPPLHGLFMESLAPADGAHRPPPSPPASPQDKSARKRKAFTTYLLPLFGIIVLAYASSRFALGCRTALARRAAASTQSRRPRRSQYKKAAVETPDADVEDDEPRAKFSTVDLDDTLSQAYDFD